MPEKQVDEKMTKWIKDWVKSEENEYVYKLIKEWISVQKNE